MKLLAFFVYLVPMIVVFNQIKAQETLELCPTGQSYCMDAYGKWCCDNTVACCHRSCCLGKMPQVMCFVIPYSQFEVCCPGSVYESFTAALQNSQQKCQALDIPKEKCCGSQQCPDDQVCCEDPFRIGEEFQCCTKKEFEELQVVLSNKATNEEQLKQ